MQPVDLSPGLVYRAEGNANIVVAIKGTGMVLRYDKRLRDNTEVLKCLFRLPKSRSGEQCEQENLFAVERFVNNIFKPILDDFISTISVVILDESQLETIRTSVTSFRPLKRLSKNIYTPYALLMTDQCLLPKDAVKNPIIAVEIKPKQGFLGQKSNSDNLTCNFCTKQNYLSKTGKDGGLKSEYCPLDLFSGNLSRMERAFDKLMKIPKNNLRVFMDGSLLNDENSTETEECDAMIREIFQSRTVFKRTLIEMLTSTSSSGELGINSHDMEDKLKRETRVPSTPNKHSCLDDKVTLPRNCVLDRILRLQTCSTSDVEAEKLVTNITRRGINQTEIQKIISGDHQMNYDLSEEATENILELQQYCMSVTAKDLSIIVTLCQKDVKDLKPDNSDQITVHDKMFRYKVSVIDLDPKSLDKIPNYIKNKRLWSSI